RLLADGAIQGQSVVERIDDYACCDPAVRAYHYPVPAAVYGYPVIDADPVADPDRAVQERFGRHGAVVTDDDVAVRFGEQARLGRDETVLTYGDGFQRGQFGLDLRLPGLCPSSM